MKRHRRNNYQGCWFIDSKDQLGRKDRTYYCRYKKDGKPVDAKHGRKSDGKTWDSCKSFRRALIDGHTISAQEKRAKDKSEKEALLANTLETIFKVFSELEGKNGVLHKNQASWTTTKSIYNKHLAPRFGENKDLTTISHRDYNDYKRDLLKSRSPQTVHHILRILKSLCKMVGNSLVGEYHAEAKLPTVKNQTTEDLTPAKLDKLKKVLATYPNRILCDLLSFIMTTGVRQGEALRLQVKHLNFSRKLISLVDRKSNGKDMDTSIPMSRATETILRRRIEENLKLPGSNNYIFPGKGGKKRFDSQRAKAIMIKAGLPKSFRPCHGLRHVYTNQLVDSGVQIHVVSKLLGHNSIATTERYFVAREQSLHEAANIIGDMLEGEG